MKLVGRIEISQITGMVAAPDLGKVFAADGSDDTVFAIDERTFKFTAISLGKNERPDSLSYDQNDHIVFASDRGAPSPDVINPANQNLAMINAVTDAVTKVNIGKLHILPTERTDLAHFGYDLGHNRYDPLLHREFVTIQQLTDQRVTPAPIPPGGTGELVAVDPASRSVVGRVPLPNTCGMPHGMTLDAQQQIAFVACTANDPAQNLTSNLVGVDVRAMKVIAEPQVEPLTVKPDILAFDDPMHVLMVACTNDIVLYSDAGGHIQRVGDYVLGKQTHTLVVDEQSQFVYLPLIDAGGRPTLRVVRYNPNGS